MITIKIIHIFIQSFPKINLIEEMFNLYKGTPEDKLKALKIAQEFAEKSTLLILIRSLKDVIHR